MEECRYDALEVAKYVINKCTVENYPVSNLQLQKILYFLQKKYLIQQGRRLFKDAIEAWQFGPVVSEVYYQYCGFGSMTITMEYPVMLSSEDRMEIDPVVEEKRTKKPWYLVAETHAPGKAWDEIYQDGLGNRKEIPVDLIRTWG